PLSIPISLSDSRKDRFVDGGLPSRCLGRPPRRRAGPAYLSRDGLPSPPKVSAVLPDGYGSPGRAWRDGTVASSRHGTGKGETLSLHDTACPGCHLSPP